MYGGYACVNADRSLQSPEETSDPQEWELDSCDPDVDAGSQTQSALWTSF